MRGYCLIGLLVWLLGAVGGQTALAGDEDNPLRPVDSSQAGFPFAGDWAPEDRTPLPGLPPPIARLPEKPEPDAAPHPQPPAALTLEDLQRIALQSNPTIVQARMAVQAAEGRYVQAGLYPNPVVGYSGGDMGLEGTAGQQGVTLGQEIVTGGKLRLGRAVAAHEIQQARHGLEMQRWRVLNDVRAGCYEVLLAQKRIAINDELVRIGENGLAATEKLRAAEEVSRADILQARIEAEKAKLGLVQARNDHRTAWRKLASVVGQPAMEPAPLAGNPAENLPELNFEDVLAQLMSQSPELAQARAGVERARCDLARQRAKRMPNVELGMWIKQDQITMEGVADVELAMPLPVFNRNQGGITEAQAGLIAADRELRRIELALHRRLAEAFGTYINARRRVEAYTNTILPDARESRKLVSDNYPEHFGYLELLTAQRTFFSVNLECLAALEELWARSIAIEGLLLSGSLKPLK